MVFSYNITFLIDYFSSLYSNSLHLRAPAHPDLVYSSIDDNTTVLLLTDPTLAGFQPGSSGSDADIKTIELTLAQLAKLHALSYDFLQNHSSDNFKILEDHVPLAGKRFDSDSGLDVLLQSLQPPNDDYSSRLKTLFTSETYFEMCRKVFGPR